MAKGMASVKTADPDEVRAAYRLHDEVESNPASRELFRSNPPDLDDAQRRIVDELDEQGYSVVSLPSLFSVELWDQLAADADEYTREIEALLDGRPEPVKKIKPGAPKKPEKKKAFLGRRYKKTPLTLDSPWLQLAGSTRMLDIVNTYLGMWTKLSHADQWYSPARGSTAERLGSMRWHRDYNDQHLVKVFTYLVDVDEGTGPFEYVTGSVRNGPYANEWPWEPLGESYPPQDEFARRIPESAMRTFTAPAGSMIFCNTSGFHRGGFATANPRNIWVYNYVSPAALASLVERNFDVGDSIPADYSEVQRFALT